MKAYKKYTNDQFYDDNNRSFMSHKSIAHFNSQKQRTLSTSKSTTHKIHSNYDTDQTLSFTQNTVEPAYFKKDLSLTNSIKKEEYGNILNKRQREFHGFVQAKKNVPTELLKAYAPEAAKVYRVTSSQPKCTLQGTTQNKKRSQSKLLQCVFHDVNPDFIENTDQKLILSANHSYIANLNISNNTLGDYRNSQPLDSSAKTGTSSHIVSDSSKRRDNLKCSIAKIEAELYSSINANKTPSELISACKRTIDDICRAEPMVSGVLNELRRTYETIISVIETELHSKLELSYKAKKKAEDNQKEAEAHNDTLLKEAKVNQKYIDNQRAIIKELKAHSQQEGGKELMEYKALLSKVKEDNKKMGKIIVKLQGETNQLKEKNKSLLLLVKGNNENECIISKQTEKSDKSNDCKVPALDLSKLMKKAEAYKPIVKKATYMHHSSSSSSISSDEIDNFNKKPAVPKLDLSILGGGGIVEYNDEFMEQAKKFSKSWRDQLEQEQHH